MSIKPIKCCLYEKLNKKIHCVYAFLKKKKCVMLLTEAFFLNMCLKASNRKVVIK